ncbi:MAG: CsgG/HfaB family protein, partial [Elusimicrobiota bacterium]
MRPCLLGACLLLAGCGGSTALNESYDLGRIRRIGVLKFEHPAGEELGAADIFAKHLIQRGYSVVERSRLESIIDEQKLGISGLFAQSSAKDLGRILGVDALFLGQITSFEPERRNVVVAKTRETYIEPIFETVRKKRRGKKKEGEEEKDRKETYVNVQVQVGTTTRYEDREIPQIFIIDAQVGVVAKLVDVETGEIVWIGSTTGEGLNSAM